MAHTWAETQPAGDANKYWYTSAMSDDGSVIIAGVYNGRLYISTNSGTNWDETQPAGDANKYWQTSAMSDDGSVIIAGVNNGRLYLGTEEAGQNLTLTCSAGSYSLTGTSVTLTHTPASQNLTLSCNAGSYALTGTNADLTVKRNYVLACNAGNYLITGTDVTLYVKVIEAKLPKFFLYYARMRGN